MSLKTQVLIIYVSLVAITLAVFWQVNQFNFVSFDDYVYVTHNSDIQSGITLEGIRWAFSTTHAEFWHPLTWLSLMLDYQLYGLNAGGYHITNLVLHILSTLLIFWFFNHMTGAIWKSAFVAALFALHPLHVESVAWVAERKDVLSAFWGMLTLCLYVYYIEKPVIRRYLFVLFGFICALMSKSVVITLPAIMILLDYWPLRRFQSHKGNLFLWQLKEKTPFFVLSGVFVILTFYAHFKASVKYYPFYYRIVNAPVAFVTYLEKTFWPHDMACFYPLSLQLPNWQIYGSVLLIIFISGAVIALAKRFPYLFVGWLWYAITILPVIGIIKISAFAMADRYHYLPSIGIAIMLAWGIPSLIKSEKIRRNILLPAEIAFVVIVAIVSGKQCGYWKNSLELANHALRVTKDNDVAHAILAYALFEKGRLQEAIEQANEAIRLNPNHDRAYEDRAVFHFTLGQYQSAIKDINEAVRLKPDYAPRYYLRGNMLKTLGQYQSAIHDYNEAIRLKRDYAETYNERGGAYFNLGQYQRAINDYNNAIRLKQDYAEVYNNRAFVYIHQGKKDIGCADARKACELGNCRILEGAKVRGLCR